MGYFPYNIYFNISNAGQKQSSNPVHCVSTGRSLPPCPFPADSETLISDFAQYPGNSSFCCWMLHAPPSHLTASVWAADFQFYSQLLCPLLQTFASAALWAGPTAHTGKCCSLSLPWDSPHPILWRHMAKLQREAKLSTITATFVLQSTAKSDLLIKKKSIKCFKIVFFKHIWILHLKKIIFLKTVYLILKMH